MRLSGNITDGEWERAGVKLLGYEYETVVVLFSDDTELQSFRARIDAYTGRVPIDQKEEPYARFVDAIDSIEAISPNDRIGAGFRGGERNGQIAIDLQAEYLVDVEVWRPEDGMVHVVLDRIIGKAEELGGEELSRYTPPSGLLIRLKCNGNAIMALSKITDVARIDTPPQPDFEEGGQSSLTVDDIGNVKFPNVNAVRIGIIDSGVNDGHPLLQNVVVAAFGVGGEPATDENGHGTAVAAIATYGDLNAMVKQSRFTPQFKIVSARAVDADGRFSSFHLAPSLIEEAIRELHNGYGCRVINISLAQPDRPVGRRGTIWSASLDTLARELDIIIVVAAGNTSSDALFEAHGNRIPEVYPAYLLDDANRLLDPSGALNVVSVGSIAHANGLDKDDGVFVRKLAEFNEPSPFTRKGPGLRGSIKPDFVDYGGTAIFDGGRQRVLNGRSKPSTGILTLHHKYQERLFSRFSGTSFAAPLVAFKAAFLMEKFPSRSSNFIRMLLAQSADHPIASLKRWNENKLGDIHKLIGYGLPDLEKALFSDDDRVVLTAESSLTPDQFAVFELPIPNEFQSTKGTRLIRVSLAYDPPVRRTRKDYAGIGMQFDLIRDATLDEVFDAYRHIKNDEETPKQLQDSKKIKFLPSINLRKPCSLQCGTFIRKKDMSQYGNTYYLVVRCIAKWAEKDVKAQPFSVSVMMQHEATIRLYEKVKLKLISG